MSFLELFAVEIIAALIYIVVSVIPAIIFQYEDERVFSSAWLTGLALFLTVVLIWACGMPFPLGGRA